LLTEVSFYHLCVKLLYKWKIIGNLLSVPLKVSPFIFCFISYSKSFFRGAGGNAMRLERLNYNRIKIHLTFDDLYERGLTKEDIWKDSIKWQYFFHEMLEEANDLFDIEIQGSVAVEIFSLKAQGMVMILTLSDSLEEEEEELLNEGFLEMQVTVEETIDILFEFMELEDVIQVCKQLKNLNLNGGALLSKDGRYYLMFKEMTAKEEERAVAVLGEYGEPSLISIYILEEYGKKICADHAIETITKHF